MLFVGGLIVGMILIITIEIFAYILWKKVIKKKIDDAVFKMSLKILEKENERK